ncbi:hypothetical protein QR685DRAFT_573373 [Neurospora intermedia]|uniref:Uncharacterized protein n=1 Tax=Neurospora intermedia TaxID=5142 RepID=A0ABR3DA43_NEUIN
MTDLGAKRFPFVSPFVALAYYVYNSNAQSLVTMPQDSEWAAEPSTRPQMSGCDGQRARYRTVHQWQFADINYVPNKKSLPSNELGTNEMPMTELPLLHSFPRSDYTRYQEVLRVHNNVTSWLSVS